MKLVAVGSALALGIVLASCTSFPTKNMNIEIEEQDIPIMISRVDTSLVTKKFDFTTEYKSSTASSSRTVGNTSVSVSVTMEGDLSPSVDAQLRNLFLQDPKWMQLRDYSLMTKAQDGYLLFSFQQSKNYLATFTFEAPVQGGSR